MGAWNLGRYRIFILTLEEVIGGSAELFSRKVRDSFIDFFPFSMCAFTLLCSYASFRTPIAPFLSFSAWVQTQKGLAQSRRLAPQIRRHQIESFHSIHSSFMRRLAAHNEILHHDCICAPTFPILYYISTLLPASTSRFSPAA